jgi:hypothetical protein
MSLCVTRIVRALLSLALSAIILEAQRAKASRTDSLQLAPTDWRRAWVGTWTVRMTLMGVREDMLQSFSSATGEQVGRLVVTDSLTGRSKRLLVARLTLDLHGLLGRPMSCFSAETRMLALERADSSIAIHFTPEAADCGFSATVRRRGVTWSGDWSESSLRGTVATGGIRLRRLRV